MKKQYLAAGIGRPEQYTKIFSGFPLEPFLSAKNDLELRENLGIAPGDFVVGKIARLFKLKGHDDLFAVAPELVRQNPQIKFLLVGDGEWRGRFEQLAKSLRPRESILSSPASFRRTKFRAMSASWTRSSICPCAKVCRARCPRRSPPAKPVVAYDCDGAREICLEDKTGFLIPPGDLKNLTEKILHLANDPALQKKLGQCGSHFVREHFAVEKMVDDIYNLYLKLAIERGLSFPSPRQTGRGSG